MRLTQAFPNYLSLVVTGAVNHTKNCTWFPDSVRLRDEEATLIKTALEDVCRATAPTADLQAVCRSVLSGEVRVTWWGPTGTP